MNHESWIYVSNMNPPVHFTAAEARVTEAKNDLACSIRGKGMISFAKMLFNSEFHQLFAYSVSSPCYKIRKLLAAMGRRQWAPPLRSDSVGALHCLPLLHLSTLETPTNFNLTQKHLMIKERQDSLWKLRQSKTIKTRIKTSKMT